MLCSVGVSPTPPRGTGFQPVHLEHGQSCPCPNNAPTPGILQPMTPFYYDPAIERYQFSESHPLKPQRLALLRALMESYGLTAHLDWRTPEPIDESVLRRVHTPEYIEVVRQLSEGA
ncbi:MAG: hypothetical protein NZ843_02385, partial [Fimbriimonadales bacterium]|nr:hypothetical protein [Fimbriimonadales bacterium]